VREYTTKHRIEGTAMLKNFFRPDQFRGREGSRAEFSGPSEFVLATAPETPFSVSRICLALWELGFSTPSSTSRSLAAAESWAGDLDFMIRSSNGKTCGDVREAEAGKGKKHEEERTRRYQ
jgi:hypothetical protein